MESKLKTLKLDTELCYLVTFTLFELETLPCGINQDICVATKLEDCLGCSPQLEWPQTSSCCHW